jgi:hypothetical protein
MGTKSIPPPVFLYPLGGTLYEYNLDGINAEYRKNMRNVPKYEAKIVDGEGSLGKTFLGSFFWGR